uniref:Fork-head domain-containing protein n=1 Tax=Setaria digitata TaxID=48799 RepID=A0A915PVE7_9BILA
MDLIGSAVLGNNNNNNNSSTSSSNNNSNNNNNNNNNSSSSSSSSSNNIINNDNSNNDSSSDNDIINNTSSNATILNMCDNQNLEDNKSMGSLKSEPTHLIDELATVSPSSSSNIERASSTPELRIPLTTSPGANNNRTTIITDQSSTPATVEKAERPSLSYKDLIIEAIESSPEKRLKLNEIYQRKSGKKRMEI